MGGESRYPCRNISHPRMPGAADAVWDSLHVATLGDVATGRAHEPQTEFRLFRDDFALCFYVRFSGRDEGILSDFRLRDEPLWKQDALELFIADGADPFVYKELQVSPWDVHFDGQISLAPDGTRQLDLSWDLVGFDSRSVFDEAGNNFSSVWKLPYTSFARQPLSGGSWRFNAFRVDQCRSGETLLAWQKTGLPNFHVPEAFGYLDFLP